MEDKLQSHMKGADGTKALCAHPDADIVELPFGIEPGDEQGVTCDLCIAKIDRLRHARLLQASKGGRT
jgi:hypothetical protein